MSTIVEDYLSDPLLTHRTSQMLTIVNHCRGLLSDVDLWWGFIQYSIVEYFLPLLGIMEWCWSVMGGLDSNVYCCLPLWGTIKCCWSIMEDYTEMLIIVYHCGGLWSDVLLTWRMLWLWSIVDDYRAMLYVCQPVTRIMTWCCWLLIDVE